jgi:hypothetical protein
MNRKNAGIAFALCLLAAGTAGADSDQVKNCISDWTTSCSKECATSKCVSNCTTQAQLECKKDVTQPQHVFNGPVVSTPVDSCTPQFSGAACAPFVSQDVTVAPPASCTTLTGTVANKAYWGGNVTVYVVCPAGSPLGRGSEITTTTIIGQAQSSCADGSFSMTATNACSGQTGCYGLIAATPASSCETCGTCGLTTPGDPGWNTCTSSLCPAP